MSSNDRLSGPEEEFVEGDRGTRIKGFVLLAVVVVLIVLEQLTSPHDALLERDPVRAFKSSVDRLLVVAVTAAAGLFAVSIYLLRMGLKTKRSGRWPPPGTRMATRTKIRRGRYATWSWLVLISAAGIFMILAVVGLGAWYWTSRLANELAPIFQVDLNYLRRLVAREPEKDAELSIANADLRFLGVASYAVLVPAGEESDIMGCLKETDRVRIIRGTSDVIYGDEHEALIRQATAYAARYNAVIAKHRNMHVAGGCRPSQPKPSSGRR